MQWGPQAGLLHARQTGCAKPKSPQEQRLRRAGRRGEARKEGGWGERAGEGAGPHAHTRTHTHAHTRTHAERAARRGRAAWPVPGADSALPTMLYKFCIISAMNSFLHSKTDSSKGREGLAVGGGGRRGDKGAAGWEGPGGSGPRRVQREAWRPHPPLPCGAARPLLRRAH